MAGSLELRVQRLEDDIAFVARAVKALAGGGHGAGGRFSDVDHARLEALIRQAEARCDAA